MIEWILKDILTSALRVYLSVSQSKYPRPTPSRVDPMNKSCYGQDSEHRQPTQAKFMSASCPGRGYSIVVKHTSAGVIVPGSHSGFLA